MNTMIKDEVMADEGFTTTEKVLYSWLYRKSRNAFNEKFRDGVVDYTDEKMAEATGKCVNTVRRALKKLSENGKIMMTKGQGRHKRIIRAMEWELVQKEPVWTLKKSALDAQNERPKSLVEFRQDLDNQYVTEQKRDKKDTA